MSCEASASRLQAVAHVNALPKGPLIENTFGAASSTGATLSVTDPATDEEIARVADCSSEDVDRAVRAADAAFRGAAWRACDGPARGALLRRLAELLERDASRFALIEALDSGKPLAVARGADVGSSIRVLRWHAAYAEAAPPAGEVLSPPAGAAPAGALVMTQRTPLGVAAGVLPFNFPLCGAVAKLAPAIAAGCTIVLKPSAQCPLTALALGAACVEAGFPPGVVCIVPGGAATGAALVAHPLVAKVSFTGSCAVGKAIARVCADRCARVTLELGGKNALVIAPDADVAVAVKVALGANFFNAGQICVATSRVLVPEALHDAFVAGVVEGARARRLGGQFDAGTEMGPLVDAAQLHRVAGFVERGIAQGATLACGGARRGAHGCWYEPTVLMDVADDNVCGTSEIFGPVMCVQRYAGDVDVAIARANATPYGLAAVVVTRSTATALRASAALTAGTVWVNTHGVFDPSIPYGGLKHSGLGREYGGVGVAAYQCERTLVLAP